MPTKCSLAVVALSAAISLAPAGSARAQPSDAVLQVECEAFEKNSNGSWVLKRKTIVNHDIYGAILEPGSFRAGSTNVFGVDLTRVLDQNCVSKKRK